MKLITGMEAQELDGILRDELEMPGILLMDTAARQTAVAVERLCAEYDLRSIVILCGKGNNGGDGFGAARWLLQKGAEVRVLLLGTQVEDVSGDAALELKYFMQSGGDVTVIADEKALPLLEVALLKGDLIVDALLGTGFHGELSQFMRSICHLINTCGRKILAVDVPTGINAADGSADAGAVSADYTVSFLPLKKGLLLYPGRKFAGRLLPADIGIPVSVYTERFGNTHLITSEMVEELLPLRDDTAHKGQAGKAIICAGSPGFTGAAALVAQAAVKAGAGTVTLLAPLSVQEILSTKLTEVMVHGLLERMPGVLGGGAAAEILRFAEKSSVLALGPGLGTSPNTGEVIREVLLSAEVPVIIDADGLTALQGQSELLNTMTVPKLLTPHIGEMARLTGIDVASIEQSPCLFAEEFAKKWQAVIVLKGATTVVACPAGSTYLNITGCSAMATGGSGDVLTGIIAGLAAQGISLQEAAICGVALHGAAGQLASSGRPGLAAGEIAEALPRTRNILQELFAEKLDFAAAKTLL
ncbi:MAG: NAD(P)H-hydrate dehydratase [Acidaminococcaceae bacterium]|nr:NAD(P)H-hydrate dehydratase [Acidaminococcaceae bacterium]